MLLTPQNRTDGKVFYASFLQSFLETIELNISGSFSSEPRDVRCETAFASVRNVSSRLQTIISAKDATSRQSQKIIYNHFSLTDHR